MRRKIEENFAAVNILYIKLFPRDFSINLNASILKNMANIRSNNNAKKEIFFEYSNNFKFLQDAFNVVEFVYSAK